MQASSNVSSSNEADMVPNTSTQNGTTIAQILKPGQNTPDAPKAKQLQNPVPNGAAHTPLKAGKAETLAGSNAQETATAGPESSAGGTVGDTGMLAQPGSSAAGESPSLQKHCSGESAGLESYAEGEEDDEDLEEGTLDDIDEDDDADASASWHVRSSA